MIRQTVLLRLCQRRRHDGAALFGPRSRPRGRTLGFPRAALTYLIATAGCGEDAVAPAPVPNADNPRPQIVSVTPDHALAESDGQVLTVEGSGFLQSSTGHVNDETRPTTLLSSSQLEIALTALDVEDPGSLRIQVRNPGPGGGLSDPYALEIRWPLPVVSGLDRTEVEAGQASWTLGLSGKGFVSTSEVLFSGQPRQTRLVGPGALEADLGQDDLRETGAFAISVRNPAPGGGLSNDVVIELVNPVPQIRLLPTSGASAGRPGFTLVVHGTGFTASSIVRWNGQDRFTQYLSGTRLATTVLAEDVLAPGTATVSVYNPPPRGGVTDVEAIDIRSVPGAVLTSLNRVALVARDVVYDERSASLYASVTSAEGGNSVVRIDPNDGRVLASAFVGSDPARLGVSSDGSVLYVGLDGGNAVRAVALPDLVPGLQWPLPAGDVAGDIEVVPGRSGTVAVSRHRPGISPPLRGVTIYDDGIARPSSSDGHTGGNRIAFLDEPEILFGFNNSHTGFEFFTIAVSPDGARHLSSTRGLISGFYTDIEGARGRIYGTDGSIVDPGLLQRMGSIADGWAIAVDGETGRAFVLEDAGIAVYDINNFLRLATIPAAGWTMGHPATSVHRMVRWGRDGLAFLDADELFIVRSAIVD